MLRSEEILVYHLLRFGKFVFEHQFPHLLQCACSFGIQVVVRPTAPEGLFIQLYLLAGRTAKEHRSHAGVAYRQCFGPLTGRTVVPQLQPVADLFIANHFISQ